MECKSLSVLTAVLTFTSFYVEYIVGSSCIERPCASCQDCTVEQTVIFEPCNVQQSTDGAGAPSSLDVVIKYEQDPNRPKGRYPYAHVTVVPPLDNSIQNVKGIQIEVLNVDKNNWLCLTKNLSNCELSMKNLSQEFYFCLGSLGEHTYFFLAYHLPPPQNLNENSISQYVDVRKYNEVEPTITPCKIDITSSISNGTVDMAANAEIRFTVREYHSYDLYFMKHSQELPNELIEKRHISGLANGSSVVEHFKRELCFGIYSIQVEPISDEPICACSDGEFCPRTSTGEFVLVNYDSVCKTNAPVFDHSLSTTVETQFDNDAKTQSRVTNEEDVDNGSGEKNNSSSLIAIVAAVTLVGILAALSITILFINYCRLKRRKKKPDIETRRDEEIFSIEYLRRLGHQRSVSQDLSASAGNGTTFKEGETFINPEEASRYLDNNGNYIDTEQQPVNLHLHGNRKATTYPVSHNKQYETEDHRLEQSKVNDGPSFGIDTPLSSISGDSYVPDGHKPNIPTGKTGECDSISV